MKNKWIITTLMVIVIFILIGLNIWIDDVGNGSDKIETTTLQKQNIKETVIVPGELKLVDKQDVYFQGDKGELEKILVKEGDKVEEGDEIIRYKNNELSNELQQIELQLKSDHLELENIEEKHKEIDKKLKKDKSNEQLQSKHDDIKLQKQQKNLEIEQAHIEQESIKKKIDDTTVESDIDGTVLSLYEKAFSNSEQAEQQPIMQIGSLDSMKVKGVISEYDALKIKEGQPVKLTSDVMSDESWKGKIRFVSYFPEQSETEGNNSGVSYAVEATLKDKQTSLKPGFPMLMEVETDMKKTNVLPLSTVEQGADTDYVYVIKDSLAKRKEVTIGMITNEVIEIKDGIKETAKVILKPTEVSDGMEVSVQ